MQNPNLVHQKDIEAPNAADGHYPARTERQTRAEVSNLGKMTNNASQPRRETAYWGDGTRRVEYKFQHNPSRPRFGGRAGHYPTRERYYSSESGGSTGSIPPPAPRGSHLRPVVEGERTVTVPYLSI